MARRRKPKWELIIHADLESKFNEYNLFTKERQDILDHLHELEMNPFMHGSKKLKKFRVAHRLRHEGFRIVYRVYERMNKEKIVVMKFGKRTPEFYDGIVQQNVWEI